MSRDLASLLLATRGRKLMSVTLTLLFLVLTTLFVFVYFVVVAQLTKCVVPHIDNNIVCLFVCCSHRVMVEVSRSTTHTSDGFSNTLKY